MRYPKLISITIRDDSSGSSESEGIVAIIAILFRKHNIIDEKASERLNHMPDNISV